MSVANLRHELETLLREGTPALLHRQTTSFDNIAGPYRRAIVLFGAGSLARKIIRFLRRVGIAPLACADSDARKWGTQIDGLEIASPEAVVERYRDKAVFIVAIASPGHSYVDTSAMLTRFGCERVSPFLPFLWKYADILLPYYSFHVPAYFVRNRKHIVKAFELLADDISRRSFLAQIRLRLRADFHSLPVPLPAQYFPEDILRLRTNEVFVDCGAYDGDTIRALLDRAPSPRVIAFEPDPRNFAALLDFVHALPPNLQRRIKVVQAAVGSRECVAGFEASGAPGAGLSPTGSFQVRCLRLDDLPLCDGATYLKLDIEGAELDALTGAAELIRRRRPLVAACVYHRPDDLWRVARLLNSLSEYRFFFRCHAYDGFESVLYAVPPERLK